VRNVEANSRLSNRRRSPEQGYGLRANTRMHPTAAARWRTAAAGDAETLARRSQRTLERTEEIKTMFNIWASIALLGLWSCVGVIYRNSRKASRQLDEVVRLLTIIAEKK